MSDFEIFENSSINNDNSIKKDDTSDNKAEEKPVRRKDDFFDWLDIVATALVTVVLIFAFVFRVATIEGESMHNTFYDGEKVIISKIAYSPNQGDVVVISRNYLNESDKNDHDQQPIIKRVIATEGMTVKIDFADGCVYVDDEKLDEPYTATPTNNPVDEKMAKLLVKGVVVPKNCVFVLGDNRNNSLDSRSSTIGSYGNGMINEKYIIGEVYLRIFPFTKFGGVK